MATIAMTTLGPTDNNQYANWNRMRRLSVAPYVARTDTNTSRTATALSRNNTAHNDDSPASGAANDVAIDMSDLNDLTSVLMMNGSGAEKGKDGKDKANRDTLFGPNIGVAAGGPEWCSSESKIEKEGGEGEDELTSDVVKTWITKSREPSEPTTTLQALVNLKRPSIRLSPLASTDPTHPHDTSTEHLSHNQQHGLEFEFDCDAPRCAIRVLAIGVPAHLGEDHHSHQPTHASQIISAEDDKAGDRLLLFDALVDGGFGRKLHLDEGCALELAQLEKASLDAHAAATAAALTASQTKDGSAPSSSANNEKDSAAHVGHKKRFPLFRKRGNRNGTVRENAHPQQEQITPAQVPAAVTGPALTVLDAEPSPSASPQPAADAPATEAPSVAAGSAGGKNAGGKNGKAKEEEGGVKLAIRISALDGMGSPLSARNEQTTYLHVVRLGPAPPPASHREGGAADEKKESEEKTVEPEDTRPWVVKVVKREARIGPHTFHLHEIYGLSSHTAEPPHPTTISPDSTQTHTYPPPASNEDAPTMPTMLDTTAAAAAMANGADADGVAECLLCLSSPREVVLLPCRHLVACRDCAVNMVEFGAGGALVHNESEPSAGGTSAAVADASAGSGDAGEGAGTTQPVPPPAPAQARRKRKAKGWFCPVCRQPYSSLLRITTAPHASLLAGGEAGKRISVTSSIEPSSPTSGTAPHPLEADAPAAPTTEARGGGGGTFGSLTRPGFLRHFSRNASTGANGASATNNNNNGDEATVNAADSMTAPDLERGQA